MALCGTLCLAAAVGSIVYADGVQREPVDGAVAGGDAAAIALYRRRAQQYEHDAAEAEEAAAHYAALTVEVRLSASSTSANITDSVQQALEQRGVPALARQVRNAAERAAVANATATARAPYEERYRQYVASGEGFAQAGSRHTLRASADRVHAKQMTATADQEENQTIAQLYFDQSARLSESADAEQGLADRYEGVAQRLRGTLPSISAMAESAARYAAWHAHAPWRGDADANGPLVYELDSA